MLALCLLELERFGPATEHAELAVGQAPDWDFAHYALARVWAERNRDERALAAIDEALRLDPEDPDYCAFKAGVLARGESWPEVLAWSDRGLALDAEHVGCQNLRALALGRLGLARERGESLAQALAARPDDPTTHANHGWMRLERGDVEGALESFREALRLDPSNEWAREGIVSAMKAKNPVYRGMLAYFFWMSRLSPRTRWMVVLGGVFGHRLVRAAAESNPALAPWLLPVTAAYLLFLFLTWTADPLFDLLLFLSRDGRLALVKEERVAAAALGAVLFVAALLVPGALARGGFEGWAPVIAFAVLAIPISGTAASPAGWPRQVMLSITALVALLAVLGTTVRFLAGEPDQAHVLFACSLLGSMLSTWLGNGLAGVRVRR